MVFWDALLTQPFKWAASGEGEASLGAEYWNIGNIGILEYTEYWKPTTLYRKVAPLV